MRNVIGELRSEHETMARLLRILEQQIEIFEAAGQPDYSLAQDVILYFLDFPDQCHHPKEDLVAKKLLDVAPDRAEPLTRLVGLHEELADLSRNMANLMRRVLEEAELPRDKVIRAARDFTTAQRHHMAMEEEHFFPLAEALLSEADLQELEAEIFARKDPLFGATTDEHFAMLRDEILKWEEAEQPA